MPSAIPLKTSCKRMSMISTNGRRSGVQPAPPVNKRTRKWPAGFPGWPRSGHRREAAALLGQHHAAAAHFAEHGVVEVDGFVVGLAVRLVVGGDDAVDLRAEVLERGDD